MATISSSKNEWTPACIDAINTFYGRPDLPIGQPKGAGTQKASKYAKQIAEKFPNDIGRGEKVPDAMDVYRNVLAAQADGSVVLVTVGYLTNVSDLLKLPASGNQPSGLDLIRKKVKLWVCMGGNFVGKPAVDDLKLTNNNFTFDKASSLCAVEKWPGKLTFVGREVGSVPSGLKVGAALKSLPEDNPIRYGYALWFGGEPKDRHVADQTTVLYAVRGSGDFWDLESRGRMVLQPDMKFQWKYDSDPGHAYVLKQQVDGKPKDREVEKAIEKLMLQPPQKR